MSTLKVNYIQANTTSEIDINSALGTIPSLDVNGSATIGGNLNITGVSTFTGNSYVAGSLGIGTASPGTKLHLIGNQYLQGGNYFTDTTSGYFWAGNGSFAGGIYGSNSGNVTTIISPQTINLVTSSTQRLSIDSSGRITAPSQPSCSAYLSTNQNISSGTWTQVTLNTTRFNTGNNFNTTTNTFTAPVAGKYFISYTVNFALDTTIVNNGSYLYSGIRVNGSFYHYGQGFRNSVIWKNDTTLSAAQLVNLAANDAVTFWAYSDGANLLASGLERTHLAVHLLG